MAERGVRDGRIQFAPLSLDSVGQESHQTQPQGVGQGGKDGGQRHLVQIRVMCIFRHASSIAPDPSYSMFAEHRIRWVA